MAGLTRWVRPPRPWRPSKLRFEVVAQRSPGLQLVGVHARHIEQPGFAPFEPGVQEDSVEAFCFGLVLDQARARHDQRAHARGDLAAPRDGGGGAQILDAGVGAGADEDRVDRRCSASGWPGVRPI